MRPFRIMLLGERGACAVSVAGTCRIPATGFLPLAMAVASATEEEEVVFLSIEKRRGYYYKVINP